MIKLKQLIESSWEDDDAAMEKANQYFSIGQDGDSSITNKNYCWIWNGDRIIAKKGGTHGINFSHEVADKTFKGWYDTETNNISIVFPTWKKKDIDGEPTIDDLPQNVYKALQSKFGKKGNLQFHVFESFVNEMPIDTYQTIGDFSKGSSFTKSSDRAIITNPVAIQKVKNFFKGTSVDFDFYFVNTKDARQYTEIGEVKEEFLWDKLKLKPEQLKDGKINHDHVTVFFTNNKGEGRIAMTPWILAHRFGHVIKRIAGFEEMVEFGDTQIQYILEAYGIKKPSRTVFYYRDKSESDAIRAYDIAKRKVCEHIGTFKSARDKNLRNDFEFYYEIFAQYLNSGKLTFNPLPESLVLGHAAFGRPKVYRLLKQTMGNDAILNMTNTFPYYMEEVLNRCVDRIFVM